MTRNGLKKYEKFCNEIVEDFIAKYLEKDLDYYWIGDEVGDVIACGDYYFSFTDILTALRLEYPVEIFFQWNEESQELFEADKEIPTLQHYLALKTPK